MTTTTTTTVYRRPTREETTLLNRTFDRWGVFEFFSGRSIMIGQDAKRKKTVCIVPGDLEELAAMRPFAMGLVIGELKKEFVPSMAGADLFARSAKRNKLKKNYYVIINENAEKLVLYGRDIMGDSIIEVSDLLNENELVIIVNSRHEPIGVGRTRFAGRSILHKGKITITTLVDAGYYLREEG